MSTNYYLVPADIVKAGVDLSWVESLHVGQYTSNGFLLQSVGGTPDRFNTMGLSSIDLSRKGLSGYRHPSEGVPDVHSWKEWKELINDDQYAVVDEYDAVIDKAEFIKRVELDKESGNNRHQKNVEAFERIHSQGVMDMNGSYQDDEGYSLEIREFC